MYPRHKTRPACKISLMYTALQYTTTTMSVLVKIKKIKPAGIFVIYPVQITTTKPKTKDTIQDTEMSSLYTQLQKIDLYKCIIPFVRTVSANISALYTVISVKSS